MLKFFDVMKGIREGLSVLHRPNTIVFETPQEDSNNFSVLLGEFIQLHTMLVSGERPWGEESSSIAIRISCLIERLIDLVLVSHDEASLGVCLETKLLNRMVEIFRDPYVKSIELKTQILQSFCLMIQNFKNPPLLYALLTVPSINQVVLSLCTVLSQFSSLSPCVPRRRVSSFHNFFNGDSACSSCDETESDSFLVLCSKNELSLYKSYCSRNQYLLTSYCSSPQKDELESWSLCLLKSLSLHISPQTISLFHNSRFPQFPVLKETLYFLGHKDRLIRVQAYSIVLHICKGHFHVLSCSSKCPLARIMNPTQSFSQNALCVFKTLVFLWIQRFISFQTVTEEILRLQEKNTDNLRRCKTLLDEEKEFMEYLQDFFSLENASFHTYFTQNVVMSVIFPLLDCLILPGNLAVYHVKPSTTVRLNPPHVELIDMNFMRMRKYSQEQVKEIVLRRGVLCPNISIFIYLNILKNIQNVPGFSTLLLRLIMPLFFRLQSTRRCCITQKIARKRHDTKFYAIGQKLNLRMIRNDDMDCLASLTIHWVKRFVEWRNRFVTQENKKKDSMIFCQVSWNTQDLFQAYRYLKMLQISFTKGVKVRFQESFSYLMTSTMKSSTDLFPFSFEESTNQRPKNLWIKHFVNHFSLGFNVRRHRRKRKRGGSTKKNLFLFWLNTIVSWFENSSSNPSFTDFRWMACVLLLLFQQVLNDLSGKLIKKLSALFRDRNRESTHDTWCDDEWEPQEYKTVWLQDVAMYISSVVRFSVTLDGRLRQIQKKIGQNLVHLFNTQCLTASQLFILYSCAWEKVRTGQCHVCDTELSYASLLWACKKVKLTCRDEEQRTFFQNHIPSDQKPWSSLANDDKLRFSFQIFFIIRRVRLHLRDIFCHALCLWDQLNSMGVNLRNIHTAQHYIREMIKSGFASLTPDSCLLGEKLMDGWCLELEWFNFTETGAETHLDTPSNKHRWDSLSLGSLMSPSEHIARQVKLLLENQNGLSVEEHNWLCGVGKAYCGAPEDFNNLKNDWHHTNTTKEKICLVKVDTEAQRAYTWNETRFSEARNIDQQHWCSRSRFNCIPEPNFPVSFWISLRPCSDQNDVYDVCCRHQKPLSFNSMSFCCVLMSLKKTLLLHIAPRGRKTQSGEENGVKETGETQKAIQELFFFSLRDRSPQDDERFETKPTETSVSLRESCCGVPFFLSTSCAVTCSIGSLFSCRIWMKETSTANPGESSLPGKISQLLFSVWGVESQTVKLKQDSVKLFVTVASRVLLFLTKKRGRHMQLNHVLPLSCVLMLCGNPRNRNMFDIYFFTPSPDYLPFPKHYLISFGVSPSKDSQDTKPYPQSTLQGHSCQPTESHLANIQETFIWAQTTQLEHPLKNVSIHRLSVWLKDEAQKRSLLNSIQSKFRRFSIETILQLSQTFLTCDP